MKNELKFPIVAFGSNTNLDDLERYALSNGYQADCVQFSKLVKVPDHKLAFTKYSYGRGGGVLDLLHSIGNITSAALLYTNELGLEMLRKKEGVPSHYVEQEITVIDDEGREIQALTYTVKPNRRKAFVPPSERYLKICEEGFEKLGICTDHLFKAAENKYIEPWPALFTYGTLMRGEDRFPLIRKHGLICALTAFSFGSLSTNGQYPALNLKGTGFSRGDYFVSEDISSLLRLTDQIEGFHGFGSPHNLFRRTCVPVDIGGTGQRLAWLYVRDEEFDPKLIHNDWRSYLGKRRAFSEALVSEHEVSSDQFYGKLTHNYARFSQIETLDRAKVINLLIDEMCLTERTMAQVSDNWVALTYVN